MLHYTYLACLVFNEMLELLVAFPQATIFQPEISVKLYEVT